MSLVEQPGGRRNARCASGLTGECYVVTFSDLRGSYHRVNFCDLELWRDNFMRPNRIVAALLCAALAGAISALPAAAKKPGKQTEICVKADDGGETCFRRPQKDNPGEFSLMKRTLYGLKTARGKTLLKTQYTSLQVYSAHFAVVEDEQGRRVFDIDKRKFRPEVWPEIYPKDSYSTRWLVGRRPGKNEFCYDIDFLDMQDGHILNSVEGACHWEGFGKTLVVDFKLSEDETVSRLYSEIGEPVSPIVPQIVRKDTADKGEDDFLMIIGELPLDGLKDKRVYRPIGVGGDPLPLPDGAIGLLNLTLFDDPPGEFGFQFSFGWAIVYDTPTGPEYAVGQGMAGDVIARAADLPRYTALDSLDVVVNQFGDMENMLALKAKGGGWQLLRFNTNRSGLKPGEEYDLLVPYLPPEDGLPGLGEYPTLAALQQGIADVKNERSLIRAQREAAAAAEAERQQQERYAKMRIWLQQAIADGNRSDAKVYAYQLPEAAAMASYIEAFGPWGRHDLKVLHNRLQSDPAATSESWAVYNHWTDIYDTQEAEAAARAAQEYQRQLEIAAQLQYEADRAAAARANRNWAIEKHGDDTSTYDQAMQNLRDTYRQNLQRYNEGGNVWVPENPDN